jgi:hypothetical protein
MSLTYTTYVDQVANLMAADSAGANFQTMLPGMIDYAEQRIYRELDLLSTIVRDYSSNLTANDRNFALPSGQGRFVTVQGINVITPVATDPDDGTRNFLNPVSRDYLDAVWNGASGATVPEFFAMITDQTLIVGPWPDNSYKMEIIGTIRPTALSSGNPTTYLTLYLPDLFIAASMIYASGYMRNFGAQADDPKMAMSWEAQYSRLLASANIEELRKRFAGFGWTSHQDVAPTPER